MAKHYSKRASKKRAYKKRRTIRRLRNTIRRKIQRGGGPEQELFNILFPLITKLAPGVFTLVMKNLGPFLQIFILLGTAARGGSKNRSNQRGGALGLSQGTKDRLINILNNLKVNFEGNTEVIGCIDTLIAKFTAEEVDPNAPEPSSETAAVATFDPLKLQADLDEVPVTEAASPQPNEQPLDKFKRIFNDKVIGSLDRKIASVSSKFTPEEKTCLNTLKEAVLNDVVSSIRTKIDDLKKNKKFLSEMAKNTLTAGKDALVGKITALKDSALFRKISWP